MKPPALFAYVLASEDPLDVRIDTCASCIVTFASVRLTRSPAVPLKLTGMGSPATDVTVSGAPPGEIESDARALTVTLRVADAVPLLADTEKVTAPPALGVKVPV